MEVTMGLFDKAKGMLKGKEKQAKSGVDSAADHVQKVVPDEHDAKVDQGADALKQGIDKISPSDGVGT
jgi:hypothetical protein